MLDDYYPYDRSHKINAFMLAEEMGCKIQYARLSKNNKIKSKLIFDEKDISVFDRYGWKQTLHVSSNTILIEESLRGYENTHILHECTHKYLHLLFYSLQSYYRKNLKKNIPDFSDYLFVNRNSIDIPQDKWSSQIIKNSYQVKNEKPCEGTRCVH